MCLTLPVSCRHFFVTHSTLSISRFAEERRENSLEKVWQIVVPGCSHLTGIYLKIHATFKVTLFFFSVSYSSPSSFTILKSILEKPWSGLEIIVMPGWFVVLYAVDKKKEKKEKEEKEEKE